MLKAKLQLKTLFWLGQGRVRGCVRFLWIYSSQIGRVTLYLLWTGSDGQSFQKQGMEGLDFITIFLLVFHFLC